MIYQIQKDKCFPLPSYDLSTPNRVIVTVFGKVLDKNYTRLLHSANSTLDLRTVFLLDQVQKRNTISKEDFKLLKSRHLVEGRYPDIFVSFQIAEKVGDQAEYVRNKGLEEEVCKQLIIQTLKWGPTTKSVLYNVLKNALPDILTEEKKSKKLSYLLQKMKAEGIIGVEGRAAHAKWYLIKR